MLDSLPRGCQQEVEQSPRRKRRCVVNATDKELALAKIAQGKRAIEIASELKVSVTTVYSWIRSSRGPCKEPRPKRLYLREDPVSSQDSMPEQMAKIHFKSGVFIEIAMRDVSSSLLQSLKDLV